VELVGRWTYYPAQYDSKPLRDAVRAELEREPVSAALLFTGSEFLAEELDGFPPTVADRVDCMTLIGWRELWRTRGLRKAMTRLHDLSLMLRYERRVASAPFATVVVGEDDRACLERLVGSSGVSVIPNGVDVGPDPGIQAESSRPTVVFSGVMDYLPNVDAAEFFATRVWPLVRTKRPDALFRIVGRRPAPEVEALGRLEGVEVAGAVPDMGEVLAKAWVAVAPLRIGSGVRNKVLEAWAAGTPVVLTTMATNGLPGTARFRNLIQDSPRDMAAAVLRLLDRSGERALLGRAAYQEACRQSWGVVGAQVHGLLMDAMLERVGQGAVPDTEVRH
jgi:glycosyltransferase involved in cell wall biosynthesis